MPFLLAEILDFQGSAHLIGVGSLSNMIYELTKGLTAFAVGSFCLKKRIYKCSPIRFSREIQFWIGILERYKESS